MIQQNYNWNLPWKAAVGIPQEMFFLFMSTAAYMQNIGKTEKLSKCWRLFALTVENVEIKIIKK